MRVHRFFTTLVVSFPVLAGSAFGDPPDRGKQVEAWLIEGKLSDGATKLAAQLKDRPADDVVRFGLGIARFGLAVERLGRSLHRFGLNENTRGAALPFLRLPVPSNFHPEQVRPEDLRAVLVQWTKDMKEVEEVLAPIRDAKIKLPLRIGRVRLDLNGDGESSPGESLGAILGELTRSRAPANVDFAEFVIGFDYADSFWLRGYCHFSSALAEAILAYDAKEIFNHCAHLVFAKPATSFAFLPESGKDTRFEMQIADAIAFFHVWRLPLKEPERLKSSLAHLQEMIKLSRQMWAAAEAETDDDNEWIPNPRQHSAMGNIQVTKEMVQGWMEFLDEAESVLAGKKLIPFWRDDPRGVNLNRVFTRPRLFDLVLWVQGTAAVPYLEHGPKTSVETWNRFQRIFRGEFIGFALWFN